MRRAILVVAAVTAAAALAGVAVSQPSAPPPPRERPAGPLMDELRKMNESDIRSLIETVRMVRLSQELGLTDEQTVVLVRQYNRAKDDAARIQKERQEIAKELRELVRDGAPENTIGERLDQLIAKDKEALMMRFDAFERVASELTPVQKAKLYVFMGDFEKRMRSLIEEAREQFRARGADGVREMMREGGPRGFGGREGVERGRGGWRGGLRRGGDDPGREHPEQGDREHPEENASAAEQPERE